MEEPMESAELPPDFQVLAVDDNAANLRLTSLVLEEFEVSVHTAMNGLEAVGIADRERLDLIIMDVQMPILDGWETTRIIRERRGDNLPIVALSANVSDEERIALQSAGVNEVLQKPLSHAKLADILGRWFPITSNSGSAKEPTPAPAIFDSKMALQRANGNAQLANELLDLLLVSLPEDQRSINDAWEHNDRRRLRESAHRLNGALRYCGIPRLANSIDHLETIARSGTSEELAAAIGTLNDEVHALLRWRRDNPSAPGLDVDVDDGSKRSMPFNRLP